MKNPIFFLIFLIFSMISFDIALAQEEKIEILQAQALEGEVINGEEVRKLKGNVIVRQKNLTLYCDSAYQYEERNVVEAFGNARLVNENGATVTSKRMFYDGNSRQAKAFEDVVLVDEGKVLKTEELDYDMVGQIAYYQVGGKIEDAKNVLTSQAGTYDTNAKVFYFKRNVVLISKKDGDRIDTDDLTYNSVTEIAYFKGPTTITTKDGAVLNANEGSYDTRTKVSNFRGRPQVETEKYILEGDSLYYDDLKEEGIAIGRTELIAKVDSVIINGEVSKFWGSTNTSIVYGNAVARQFTETDTLYLLADTLVSISNDTTNTKVLLAYKDSKVFRKDMQAVCDSLVYNRSDSTIYLYQDPVVWNKDSQMTGDSIKIEIANNQVKKAYLRINSFVISTDTLGNHNQLKGKYLTAFFTENQIRKIDVEGNGQSIFFALEGDSVMTGMNRSECSNMVFLFKPENELETITYINKVEAQFIPPHELEAPQMKLKGFKWLEGLRPRKEEFFRRIYGISSSENMAN